MALRRPLTGRPLSTHIRCPGSLTVGVATPRATPCPFRFGEPTRQSRLSHGV